MQVRKLQILLFIFALVGLSACGDQLASSSIKNSNQNSGPVSSSEIIGGVEANEKSAGASSVVMIYGVSDEGFTQICTGTFISQSVILTAGHCVSEQTHALRVTFKQITVSGQVVKSKIPVVRVLRHESYKKNDNERNDLALIQFSGGLPHGARAAVLVTKNQEPRAGTSVVALGYGRNEDVQNTEDGNDHGSGTLRQVKLMTIAEMRDTAGFVVNQEAGKGVCFGDSGGPAFLNDSSINKNAKLIGVASAVYSSEENSEQNCSSRSLYMSVVKYREWILTGMNQLGAAVTAKD